MNKNIIIGILCFLITDIVNAEELEVKYFQGDNRVSYQLALLDHALSSTEDSDGPYKLIKVYNDITQLRGLAHLERGNSIDIAFLAANNERESRFKSIKIPLLQGLLGYRIFLIRRNSQNQFSDIQSIDDLKNGFIAGFGAQWADMEVLEHNKLSVVGASEYKSLFKMLSRERFDYFPRGVSEVWAEFEKFGQVYPNIAIEQSVAISYPFVVYFYVNKDNQQLADRIEKGLKNLLVSGSFKKLFLKFHQELIDKSNLTERKIFYLENPSLPDDIPPPDTSWWLK